jgi:pimeloyl-ACP methyl ester carboxylesterase
VLDRIQLYGICDNWVGLGPAPLVPTGTRVPTLVLAGEFDPVARPAQSRGVTDLIGPASHLIAFPRLGHNIRQFSPCGARIAAEFIDDPDRMPDTSCVDRRPPIAFSAKREAP